MNETTERPARSVGEDYPNQQARIRASIAVARGIGPAGAFYVAMGEDLLRRADRAIASGDVLEILRLYTEMTEWKE